MSSNDARFEALVDAYSGDLYRYAFWLCHHRHMAEDLVQETFMRAWRFLDSLKDESKAKSWLITTLRREHARQYERVRPNIDDGAELEAVASEERDRADNADVTSVREAMAQLPDSYREPLILQVLWGYSGDEIAELMDMPRASVNTRLFRARQQLRKLLADADDGYNVGAQ